jgi:hypothetical protein
MARASASLSLIIVDLRLYFVLQQLAGSFFMFANTSSSGMACLMVRIDHPPVIKKCHPTRAD